LWMSGRSFVESLKIAIMINRIFESTTLQEVSLVITNSKITLRVPCCDEQNIVKRLATFICICHSSS
jgi:Zn finger protein HypA/HybF involved in hydrogenase expression